MEAAIVEILSGYGLPGAGMLALGWLYMSERKDNKANQNARISETRETITAISENTAALNALTMAFQSRGSDK